MRKTVFSNGGEIMKSILITFLFLFGTAANAASVKTEPPKVINIEFAAYLNMDICETPDLMGNCKSADGDFKIVEMTLSNSEDNYYSGTAQLTYEVNGFLHKATLDVSTTLHSNNQFGDYFFSIKTEFGLNTAYYTFATGAVFAKKPENLNDIFVDINPIKVTDVHEGYYFPFILIGSSRSDEKILKTKAKQLMHRRLR